MHKVTMQYKALSLSFETGADDPYAALKQAHEKVTAILPTLSTIPAYRKLRPSDFTISVIYVDEQLDLFTGVPRRV